MIFKLIRRYLGARKIRTLLTGAGVACAMVLFVGVASLSEGMDEAMSTGESARTLVVYRKNRYCPQTSFLPERYTKEIESIPGVQKVLPVKVFLNNCRTSLDLVAFQGTPIDRLLASRDLTITDGSLEDFKNQPDAALLGRNFAERRNKRPGEKFQLGDIVVKVAGIFSSADPVDEELVMTHLEFLQRQGPINRLGTVTMFEVRIDDSDNAKQIAEQIDERFATAEEPTDTRPRLLYLQMATKDLRDLLGFAKILGMVCVAVVLVLVANTVIMGLHERRKQFGVLLALGYTGRHLAQLVIGETLLLTVTGAFVGIATALAVLHWNTLSIGVEGVSVAFSTSPRLLLQGLGIAVVVALLASIPPAIFVARARPVETLRST